MLETSNFTDATLWGLLQSLLTSCFDIPVFCIIQAVHECRPSLKEFIDDLGTIQSLGTGPLKILLTSEEPYRSVSVSERYHVIRLMDDERAPAIINSFVRARVKRLLEDKPIWKVLERDLLEKLSAMPTTYLSAVRKMNQLEAMNIGLTKVTISHKLEKLPLSLEEDYKQALAEIPDKENRWTSSALTWIIHAVRPLKLSEVAVAVALDQNTISLESLRNNIPWDFAEDLNQVIGSLVRIVDDRCYPIYRTLRRVYSHLYASNQDAHFSILSKCLKHLEYVAQDNQQPLAQLSDDGWQTLLSETEYSLLTYATLYWPQHYKRTFIESAAADRASEFIRSESNFQTWSKIYESINLVQINGAQRLETPLRVACRFGLVELVKTILNTPYHPALSSEELCQALDLAAQGGNSGVVKILLDKGAVSVDALSLAAESGSVEIMNELIKGDTHLNALDTMSLAPLHRATRAGRKKAVLMLIQRGANVNARSFDGSTALHLASRTG